MIIELIIYSFKCMKKVKKQIVFFEDFTETPVNYYK